MPSATAYQLAATVWHQPSTIHMKRDADMYEAVATVIDQVLIDQYNKCRELIKLREEKILNVPKVASSILT